jgi:hypothetical protein
MPYFEPQRTTDGPIPLSFMPPNGAISPFASAKGLHFGEPFDPGLAQRLGVGHDVRLRNRQEIARAEIAAELQLMLYRPAARRPQCAAEHRTSSSVSSTRYSAATCAGSWRRGCGGL